MEMLSGIVNAAKGVKSRLLLEYSKSIYEERADYYRQRAIIESVKRGHHIDRDNGVDLIYGETTALKLPNGNQIEFARNSEGIFFARIEGSKYYPIDIEPSERLLEKARVNERLSRNYFRRLLMEPKEFSGIGIFLYDLEGFFHEFGDTLFEFSLLFENLEKIVKETTEPTNKNMNDMVKKLEEGQ